MASIDDPSHPAAGESVQPIDEGGMDVKEESSKGKTGGWPFIEPQPIREDQVQNAVKFLSHPKVRSSPILHRRSFLEKKGLSKEEIDEAFQRVPDTRSNESTKVSASRQGQYNTAHGTLQSQATVPQNQAVLPSQQHSLAQQPVGAVPLSIIQAKRPVNWSHILLAIGFFSVASVGAGALIMNVLVPKFKAWIRRIILEEDHSELLNQRRAHVVEEASALAAAIAAANAAAVAATQVAEASQEMIKSWNEDCQHLTSFAKTLEGNIQQLSNTVIGMKASLPNVDWPKELNSSPLAEPNVIDVRKGQMNGTWRTLSPIEQVETREGIKRSSKEVNDKPPNPNQPLSSSRLQRKRKPWETLQVQSRSNMPDTGTQKSNVSSFPVVENVAKSTSATESRKQGASAVDLQTKYASFTQSVTSTGNNIAEPWWRRTKAEPELHNVSSWAPESSVRKTELDSIADRDSNLLGSSSQPGSSDSRGGIDLNSSAVNVKVGRQGWAPPPVPSTMMPGAAAAIRYSKVAAKDDEKILPSTQEDPLASSISGHNFPKEASSTEHAVLPLVLSPQLVPLYEEGEGQGRETPEHVPLPSQEDFLDEEADGQEEL